MVPFMSGSTRSLNAEMKLNVSLAICLTSVADIVRGLFEALLKEDFSLWSK
jgi:hypothetical protein